MPEFSSYQWTKGKNTGFEAMMTYAWYIFIENKNSEIRDEAETSLEMIKTASHVTGLCRKQMPSVTIKDFVTLRWVIAEIFEKPGGAIHPALYMLKFIQLLNERRLVDINLIDLAIQL